MNERDDDHPDDETLRQEACAWVLRLQANDATTADQAEVLRWRARSPAHARALGEAVRLRRLIVTAGRASDEAWLSHRPQMRFPVVPARPSIGRRALVGAIAASAAGILSIRPPMGLWPSLAELRSSYRTGAGEKRTIALAQGVSVELNTRTSISLRDEASQTGLNLVSGEVGVDAAAPLRPVAIHTGAGVARTRHGRFGVRLDDDSVCVTCSSGSVEIAAVGGKALLAAGHQIAFTSEGVGPVTVVDVSRAEAWRRGLMIFVDAPLRHVVAELNRYRAAPIILADARLRDFPVNAVYHIDRLDGAVEQISQVSDAHVTRLPGGIVVLT